MKVPVLDQPQVQAQDAMAQAPQLSKPVAESYGTDVADALQKLGGTVEAGASKIGDHMIELQHQENERQVIQQHGEFVKDLQNKMKDTSIDPDTGAPKGFLVRQLGQAAGATQDFDQAFKDMKQQYLDSVGTDLQKATLSKLMDSTAEGVRGEVISHEAQARQDNYKATLDSNIKMQVLNAGNIQDADHMSKAIDQATTVQEAGMRRLGMDDNSIALNKQMLASEMVKSSFESLLTTDYRKAQALFEGVKDQLPETAVASMEKSLQGKLIDDKQSAIWDQVKDLKLADGSPDFQKMDDFVSNQNLPKDQEEKISSYIKAKAGEARKVQQQQSDAMDHDFKNQVFDLKQKGGSLDDAYKLAASKFGGDNVQNADLKDIATKIFTTDVKTDPQKYVQLWTDIKSGQAGKSEINQGFKDGWLSGQDMIKLTEENFNTAHKEDDFYRSEMIKHLDDLATAQYGSDAKKKAEFKYATLVQSRGKSPEEMWKVGNDLLKKDPNSGWIFQDPQWKSSLKQQDASNEVWGKIHEDIGQDTARAIGQGMLLQGAKSWGVSDIQSFGDALGGYDRLKKGTPENNAIQSLAKKGKIVTPDSVRAVLSIHKDGVWR